MFTLFFVLLGSSAAIWGGWLEHAGPRKAGVYAAFCWCGGLLISAIGVATHQLWMLWAGWGIIRGIGLGPWLFRLHARWRLQLRGTARGMDPGRLEAARQTEGHEHDKSRRSEGRAQDAAILADLGGPVSQRLGGYRDHRRGIANV